MRLGIMELENNSEVKEAYDFFRALRKGLKSIRSQQQAANSRV